MSIILYVMLRKKSLSERIAQEQGSMFLKCLLALTSALSDPVFGTFPSHFLVDNFTP